MGGPTGLTGEASDDPSISSTVDLWRRLTPGKHWIVWDERERRSRASSAAVQNLEARQLSVCITCDAPADFSAEMFKKHPGYGVAAITAGQCRVLNQGVVRAPAPDEIAHGHMVGDKP